MRRSPDNAEVQVFDATTGAELAPTASPGADLTGVCLGDPSLLFLDGFESADTGSWDS